MPSESHTTAGDRFLRLVGVMARLRAPGGCPWDREQTFDTIKPYLLEETYEVLDAIDARDWHGLAEEIGDLMLQAVFFAQMASEEGRFNIEDSLDAILDLEYFHDHARIETMLFDGALAPVHGALQPDRTRPGFGLDLKRQDAEKWRVSF